MKANYRWLLMLLAIAVVLPIAAQAQTAAQKKAQRAVDEQAVRDMPDQGADFAFVIFTSQIRKDAKPTGTSLESVKRGDILSLVERAPATAKFYRVVKFDTGIEGWIDAASVVIKLTKDPNNAPAFEEEDIEATQNPIVSITNLEKETDLNLRINGVLYVVKASSTQEIPLKPGEYQYYGWSRGIRPAIGRHTLAKGKKYTWSFRIYRR